MILLNGMRAIVALVALALDIAAFFVLVRLTVSIWSVRWLAAFDDAGGKIVRYTTHAVEQMWSRATGRRPTSPKAVLLLTLAFLAAARLVASLTLQVL